MHRSSSLKRPSLLVVAISGRAIAQSARRAGFVPLVADFFTDRRHAGSGACLPQARGRHRARHGMAQPVASARNARRAEPLTHSRSRLWLWLRGPSGAADAASPRAGPCSATINRGRTDQGSRELLRRARSSRGRPSRDGEQVSRKDQTHERVARQAQGRRGRKPYRGERNGARTKSRFITRSASKAASVSALFVANGREARVLGFSEQWTAPSKRSPWRYGGAVRPARLAAAASEAMVSAVERAASAFYDQRPRLGRFHGERAKRAAARDQPPPRRHARHLRQRGSAAPSASPRRGDRGQAAARALQASKAPWPRPSFLRPSELPCPSP